METVNAGNNGLVDLALSNFDKYFGNLADQPISFQIYTLINRAKIEILAIEGRVSAYADDLFASLSKASKLASDARDFENLIWCEQLVGEAYERLNDNQKALTYFNNVAELSRAHDTPVIAGLAYAKTAKIKSRQKQEFVNYANVATENFNKKPENGYEFATGNLELAIAYAKTDLPKAIEFAQLSQSYFTADHLPKQYGYMLAYSSIILATLYQLSGNQDITHLREIYEKQQKSMDTIVVVNLKNLVQKNLG